MNKVRVAGTFGGALILLLTSLLTTPQAQGEDLPEGEVTYMTEVEFIDGSSLLTDVTTGVESIVPTADGLVGLAGEALETGSVATTAIPPDTSSGSDDTDQLPPGDSGEDTVHAGAAIPAGGSGGGGGVTTQTSTPDGFHLYGTNTTAYGYTYTSDYLATRLKRCQNGTCTEIGRVDNRIKEYVYSGGSIRWQITPSTVYRYGPAYDLHFTYWCGVNIPSGNDITCRTNDSTADGSGVSYVTTAYSIGNTSYAINKSFGSGHSSYAKFPMIEMDTYWDSYGVKVSEKFRGWDIRKYSSGWKMSPVSGTGY